MTRRGGARRGVSRWRRPRLVPVAAVSTLLALALPVTPARADHGLDPTFGDGGTLVTTFGPRGPDQAEDLVTQPDGRVVVAGLARGPAGDADFALARYLPNGRLDPTFGADGRVLTNFRATETLRSSDGATSVALQADGKILAAGGTNFGEGRRRFALARYLPDGTPDPTFGDGGRQVVRIRDCSADERASELVVQPDGRIVVVGDFFRTWWYASCPSSDSESDFAVARLLPTGELDPSFGDGGRTTVDFGGDTRDYVEAVVIQPGGELVVAGWTDVPRSADGLVAVARLTESGTPDPAFAGDGTATFRWGETSRRDVAFGLAVQEDGKLLVAGSRDQWSGSGAAVVARYEADGGVDEAFGERGVAVTRFSPYAASAEAYGVALEPGGRIVLGGPVLFPKDPAPYDAEFGVARLGRDGRPDRAFGHDGASTGAIPGWWVSSNGGLSVQPDGRVVLAATALRPGRWPYTLVYEERFGVARFLADGGGPPSPDSTPPETSITEGPAGTRRSPAATFRFVSSERGATFGCRLDDGDWEACSSPKAYDGLSDGEHTFAVRATDAAGNVEPEPATRTWRIDTTPPDTEITYRPPAASRWDTASFAFQSEPEASLQCRLDGGEWELCWSPKSYHGLAEGEHTFAVRATDAAGNVDRTPATHTWTVDMTPPDTAITDGPAEATRSGDATFAFSSEAGATFRCRLDGDGWTPCSSPATYFGLEEGEHSFAVHAVDAAGNADPTPPQWSWRVEPPDPPPPPPPDPAPSADRAPPPSNTQPPGLSGPAVEGQILTGSTGSWTPAPRAYDFAWRRCDVLGLGCTDIAAANGDRYTLTSADVGHTVRLQVTASNEAGANSAQSPPSEVVRAAAPPSLGPWSPEAPPLEVSVKASDRLSLGAALRRGIPLGASCSRACSLAATVSLGPAAARRLGLARGRAALVARGASTRSDPGELALVARFTRQARRVLAGVRAIRLVLEWRAADTGGALVEGRQRLPLRR